MPNRIQRFLEGDTFGETGLGEASGLTPFDAYYRFADRTFSIVIWARDWEDAQWYCDEHGMRLEGEIDGVM